jgi:hypothetical protein
MKRNRQRSRRRMQLSRRIALTEQEIAADLHFPASVKAVDRSRERAK